MDFSLLNMVPPDFDDGRTTRNPSKPLSSRRTPRREETTKNGSETKVEIEESKKSPCFFNWREVFPELEVLYNNQDILKEEMNNINHWVPWPEDHFHLPNDSSNTKDWTVFPLVHTFPAYEESKRSWVNSTCAMCPKTVNLLKQLPNLRTALFSKLGPGTKLSSHTGWADLANYVLRVHICLQLPVDGSCGLLVDGEVQYHQQDQIIVFDDSKPHRAFNYSEIGSRIVLIIDLLRPRHIAKGTATGEHTPQLDDFVALFR